MLARVWGAGRRRVRDVREIALSTISRLASRPLSRRGDHFIVTGWYGTETVGDQAILGGLLEIIPRVHDGPIVVASLEPSITAGTLQELKAPRRVVVRSYDETREIISRGQALAVAMGGGPVMGTIDPITDVFALHREAWRSGVPVGFLGCGVGPLGRLLRRKVIAELLRSASCITVRDADSREKVVQLATRPAVVSGDPALIWLGEQEGADESGPERAVAGKVGLALRRWPVHEFGEGRVDHSDRQRLENELTRFAKRAASEGWEVEPIAMGFLAIGGDDRVFLKEVLGSLLPSGFTDLKPSPRLVRDQMSRCKVVVAMRYHACLFALAAGRPVVAIDYTLGGKVAALHREYGDRVTLLDPRDLDERSLREAIERTRDHGPLDVKERAAVARRTVEACVEQLVS